MNSTEATAAVCGLMKVLVDNDIVEPQPIGPPTEETVRGKQVHVSFSKEETDGMLLKSWVDDEQRLHVVAQWST